jgi:hypothetical protein
MLTIIQANLCSVKVSTDEANPVWLELDSLTEKSKNKVRTIAFC